MEFRNVCLEGNLEKVKEMVQKGADVNGRVSTGNLVTPLHNATSRGHEKVVAYLLDQGADISARNNIGETPLHLAIRHNFPNLVILLLDRGANIQEGDNEENSPLHKAAMMGFVRIIEILLQRGADRNALNDESKKPIDVVKSQEAKEALKK